MAAVVAAANGREHQMNTNQNSTQPTQPTQHTFRIGYQVKDSAPGSRWTNHARVIVAADVNAAHNLVQRDLRAGHHVRFTSVSIRCAGSARCERPGMGGHRQCRTWVANGTHTCHAHTQPVAPTPESGADPVRWFVSYRMVGMSADVQDSMVFTDRESAAGRGVDLASSDDSISEWEVLHRGTDPAPRPDSAVVAQMNRAEREAMVLRQALREVRTAVCESGNSITDNAEEWSMRQIRNHAQETNCRVAGMVDSVLKAVQPSGVAL